MLERILAAAAFLSHNDSGQIGRPFEKNQALAVYFSQHEVAAPSRMVGSDSVGHSLKITSCGYNLAMLVQPEDQSPTNPTIGSITVDPPKLDF